MTLQTRAAELHAAQRVAADPYTAQRLDDLFAGREGQVCLGYIDGDPSIPKGTPGYSAMHSKYYEWPRERLMRAWRNAYADSDDCSADRFTSSAWLVTTTPSGVDAGVVLVGRATKYARVLHVV